MKPWPIAFAVAMALVLPACGGGGQAAACGSRGEPAHPEVGGELLFSCFNPAIPGGELYLLDVSSGRVRALTSDGAWNLDASWSPDGRRIVYQTTRDGHDNVYVLDLASSTFDRLSDGRGFNGYPAWSPDGAWIAFESSRDGVLAEPDPPGYYRTIYLVHPDGSGAHRLLGFNDNGSGPAWSPHGDRIAFSSDRGGAYDLYVVSPDGSGLQQLTRHDRAGGFATYPRWSPDGKRIAFNESLSTGARSEVFLAAADGSSAEQLTDDPHAQWEAFPDWSPDGKWIAFTQTESGSQLFAVRPDGSGLVQLTTDGGDKNLARWRP